MKHTECLLLFLPVRYPWILHNIRGVFSLLLAKKTNLSYTMQKILETARGQGQFFVFNVVRSVVFLPHGII